MIIFDTDEKSLQDGKPVEMYRFTYANVSYSYTSAQTAQRVIIDGVTYIFSPEYIKRSDELKILTTSNQETCTITVNRTNNVALLYQGAPPELGQVEVSVFRKHMVDDEVIQIISGTIRQVVFNGSEAMITVAIDNIMSRQIPRCKLSYFCQNCMYDNTCALKMGDWGVQGFVDRFVNNMYIYSTNLREKESGYFTDGLLRMGNTWRKVALHQNDMIKIKYPLAKHQVRNKFVIYPGCSGLFKKCAETFHNHRNFSGIIYKQPFNVYKHNSYDNTPAYWVNSDVITRDSKGQIHSMGL